MTMTDSIWRQLQRVLPGANPRLVEQGRGGGPGKRRSLEPLLLVRLLQATWQEAILAVELHRALTPTQTPRQRERGQRLQAERVIAGAQAAQAVLEQLPLLAPLCGTSAARLEALLRLRDAYQRGQHAYAELAAQANDGHSALGGLAYMIHQASVEWRAERWAALSPVEQQDISSDCADMDQAAGAAQARRVAKGQKTRREDKQHQQELAAQQARVKAAAVAAQVRAGQSVAPQDLIAAYGVLEEQQQEGRAEVAAQLQALRDKGLL